MKDATLEGFANDIKTMADLLTTITATEQRHDVELTPLRNQRDDLAKKLNTTSVNARSSIKGSLGADSTEYELAGGSAPRSGKRAGREARPRALSLQSKPIAPGKKQSGILFHSPAWCAVADYLLSGSRLLIIS